jgi:malate dehydrogenase (oxaloacetate-decarboxylating)
MTAGSPVAIRTRLRSFALIDTPLLNKGSAFTADERAALGLDGLLPPAVETIETQVARAYAAYQDETTDLERHIFLRALQDTNETLFYRLLADHLTELMPIVYTPVVGLGCQNFSEIYRRPRGLFLSYPLRDKMDEILAAVGDLPVEVIVVTDGERILGLGDQGAGGMGIPIGKLSLYTACGGIAPETTLPILLDVGTNNKERLEDPLYIGWRHERVAGADYEAFVDRFVAAVKKRWPNVLLQFEDFAQSHATLFLDRYRDALCMFNDDIQGTAAVVVGAAIAAAKVAGLGPADQKVVVVGAGSAGCGIAEQMIRAAVEDGVGEAEARARFFMVDREGLVLEDMTGLYPFQARLAQTTAAVAGWRGAAPGRFSLMEVIENVRPTMLVGVSGQPGIFTEAIVRQMAQTARRPIIFPLSNPTSRCEALPSDLIHWTEGRAIVATGSPFDPVSYGGKSFPVAQSNNSYIFPGLGLGIRALAIPRVSGGMFMASSRALADRSPALADPTESLLPALAEIRAVSRHIALGVGRAAMAEGLIATLDETELAARVDARMWQPAYRPMVAEQ